MRQWGSKLRKVKAEREVSWLNYFSSETGSIHRCNAMPCSSISWGHWMSKENKSHPPYTVPKYCEESSSATCSHPPYTNLVESCQEHDLYLTRIRWTSVAWRQCVHELLIHYRGCSSRTEKNDSVIPCEIDKTGQLSWLWISIVIRIHRQINMITGIVNHSSLLFGFLKLGRFRSLPLETFWLSIRTSQSWLRTWNSLISWAVSFW